METTERDAAGFTYLDIVERYPVEPPTYESTLPRMKRPAYDTFDPLNETLPQYTPTSYKIGILTRKLEWTSPLELAQQRHWKQYIFELNNTQLNLYECPKDLRTDQKMQVGSSFSSTNSHTLLHPYHYHHIHLRRLQGVVCPTAFGVDEQADFNEDNYRSIMTTKSDLRALKYFKSINALEAVNIVRSYSLQYGRIGLAIDYKKRTKVLRCRFESEQFLMEFENTEGMIEWFTALNLGIDNALDISRREMPSYRTVPRRRRRIKNSHTGSFNSMRNVAHGFGIALPQVSSNSSGRNGESSKNSTDVGKKGSRRLMTLKNRLFKGGGNSKKMAETVSKQTDVVDLFQIIHQPDEPEQIDDLEVDEDGFELERPNDGDENDVDVDVDDIDDDEEEFAIENHIETVEEAADISDDEPHIPRTLRSNSSNYIGTYQSEEYSLRSYVEYISKPTRYYAKHTYQEQRKVLRDSLRCMPPLTDNERWIGRYIVLDFDPRYQPQSKRDVELHFASMEVKTHLLKVGNEYVHHWKRSLQEWIVTPSGLMPYLNENWNR